ncbi:MAG: hypothetical protein KA154_09250 [Gemmatimonadaceae bacterium]|nr:hypothetical protein [Gemmatimonadaceae bacterium]
MVKTFAVIVMLLAGAATEASAQQRDTKYVVGIRSALITGTMKLSGLDPAFDDLKADGPEGPHMSGFFFLVRVRPHLSLGVETLVANSDQNARTSMNYQAAGPVVELSYGASWFVSGGVHGGALIVNAMAREEEAQSDGATAGSFFKGNGWFVAPSLDLGYRARRGEIGLFMKQVNVTGEKQRGGLSDFGATFIGLRLALRL